jgi:hypothetical protein
MFTSLASELFIYTISSNSGNYLDGYKINQNNFDDIFVANSLNFYGQDSTIAITSSSNYNNMINPMYITLNSSMTDGKIQNIATYEDSNQMYISVKAVKLISNNMAITLYQNLSSFEVGKATLDFVT